MSRPPRKVSLVLALPIWAGTAIRFSNFRIRRREMFKEFETQPMRTRVRLTKREIEVLTMVARGLTTRQVADALCLSPRTVDFHLAGVYSKLRVSNRVQAIIAAGRAGLLATNQQFADENATKN